MTQGNTTVINSVALPVSWEQTVMLPCDRFVPTGHFPIFRTHGISENSFQWTEFTE